MRKIIEHLGERILGRFAQDSVVDPVDGTVFAQPNDLLDVAIVDKIEKSNVFQVKVRSVLTCDASHGVCVKCYGLNLASNRHARLGDSVGIMAAQSIGEPELS